ncbi:MAG: glycosyltransferase [Propionibacteriaceae bacterium]|nr:glycosyltransferase [Propionibacteriaceae bacterium]
MLLTNLYPYARGEEFIEIEIAYLAEAFDQIIIIPTASTKDSVITRLLPPKALLLADDGPASRRRFSLRHPMVAIGALLRSLRHFPSLRHCLEDFKFDLTASRLVNRLAPQLTALLEEPPTVVFYGYWMQIPARVALALRSRLGLYQSPVIARAHRYDLYQEANPTNYLPQRKRLLKGLTRVYSVSKDGQDYLRNRYPSYAPKIDLAHLGVEAATNPANPTQATQLVLSCSYITPIKRLPLLIEALALLQRRGRSVRWAHLGCGGPGDAYATQVITQAKAQLAPDSYTFTGNLTNAAVRTWLADHPATVFVNVSESEGAPVAIMEALAQGLPIVVTDVGGNRELVDLEGGMFDGLLNASPTPHEISDRIDYLLSIDEASYRRWVEASLAHWCKEWSSAINFRRFSTQLAAFSPDS